VHFVTAQFDAGPAIVQGRVRVAPDDTESSLPHAQSRSTAFTLSRCAGFEVAALHASQAWLDAAAARAAAIYRQIRCFREAPAGMALFSVCAWRTARIRRTVN